MRANHPNAKIRERAKGLTELNYPEQWAKPEIRFNGKIRENWDRLSIPATVKKPTIWAVWSDLFHPEVTDTFIESAFVVMETTPWHRYMILTKRPERAAEFVNHPTGKHLTRDNVWFGTTVENQKAADERIPELLKIPAAVRFLSLEPLLGPVDFRIVPGFNRIGLDLSHWLVICGCESGKNRRKTELDDVRSVRD